MPMHVDWDKIDTVLLDMDGTLLDLQYDNYFWREHVPRVYAREKGISISESYNLLEPIFRDREGSLDWYCIEYWSDRLGLDIASLKHEQRHMIAIRPSVPEFLDRLSRELSDVRLVTNAHQKVVELKMRETGLARYFDWIITSHEIGAPKEDVRFWSSYSKLQPFNAQRCLLIDDSPPVLIAAREFGIAWLRAIRLPDLSAGPREHAQFHALDSFSELYRAGIGE
jgi:HAD superfamily hydrolase (TIGR01509 family)